MILKCRGLFIFCSLIILLVLGACGNIGEANSNQRNNVVVRHVDIGKTYATVYIAVEVADSANNIWLGVKTDNGYEWRNYNNKSVQPILVALEDMGLYYEKIQKQREKWDKELVMLEERLNELEYNYGRDFITRRADNYSYSKAKSVSEGIEKAKYLVREKKHEMDVSDSALLVEYIVVRMKQE